MLDIYACSQAGLSHPILRDAEFLRIELSARADGLVVSLTATTVDQDEPQLLDQEITCERVASIDELVALIKRHVRLAEPSAPSTARLS
jgi:hypothetical protein